MGRQRWRSWWRGWDRGGRRRGGSGQRGRRERVRGGGLRGGYPVEVFPEGMDGDAASFAELGLGQAATAELAEEGVPAEVEDVAPGMA